MVPPKIIHSATFFVESEIVGILLNTPAIFFGIGNVDNSEDISP
jgi:hypothetical protein